MKYAQKIAKRDSRYLTEIQRIYKHLMVFYNMWRLLSNSVVFEAFSGTSTRLNNFLYLKCEELISKQLHRNYSAKICHESTIEHPAPFHQFSSHTIRFSTREFSRNAIKAHRVHNFSFFFFSFFILRLCERKSWVVVKKAEDRLNCIFKITIKATTTTLLNRKKKLKSTSISKLIGLFSKHQIY